MNTCVKTHLAGNLGHGHLSFPIKLLVIYDFPLELPNATVKRRFLQKSNGKFSERIPGKFCRNFLGKFFGPFSLEKRGREKT